MEGLSKNQREVVESRKLKFRNSFDGKVEFMDSSISWNIFERPYEIVGHPDMSGVYEHFKSVSDNVRLYYVHCAVRNIETDDCIVIYEPLYIPEGRVYGRPLKEFTEIVNVEEGQAPRFRYINL